jgi:uncharacterized BrkB/YihY/UPF0761 family membrane protein
VYWLTILGGLLTLFAMLCVTYFAVPNAVMPWSSVWPGALGATIAMGIVDIGFPLYLSHVSTLRIGSSAVFALIALLWFYILALVLMAGAVMNELRLERRRASAAARVGDVEWPRRRLRRPSATASEVAAPATGAEAKSPE